MKGLLNEDAEADVDFIDAWWPENRKDAPDLFRDELTGILELLASSLVRERPTRPSQPEPSAARS